MSVDMWLPTTDFLPRSSLPHVLCGLDDAVAAVVDDFDAGSVAHLPIVEIDPAALLPTQEIIDAGNLAALAFAIAAQSLPPIHVVAVAATRELRILDGHHRACLAVLRGERVAAWVLEV